MPVPDAEPLVDGLRRRYDPTCEAGIPAHITVLYPFIPVEPPIIDQLRDLFAGVASFPFSLTRVERFPEVVYLRPVPGDPFARLTAAIVTLWPEARPYGGRHEEIIPHLTVARTADPGVVATIDQTLRAGLPIETEATEVWLMTSGGDGWEQRHRFPLSV